MCANELHRNRWGILWRTIRISTEDLGKTQPVCMTKWQVRRSRALGPIMPFDPVIKPRKQKEKQVKKIYLLRMS